MLGGHDAGQVVLVGQQQFEPLAQQRGAFLGGTRAPRGQGAVGGLDGLAGLVGAEQGYLADTLAGGGIGHFDMAFCIDPAAIDKALLAQQGGVLELQHDLVPVP